jgi:hypothetical protein
LGGGESNSDLDDVLVNCGRSCEREGNAHRNESARYVEEAENHSGNLHGLFVKKKHVKKKIAAHACTPHLPRQGE